MGVTRTVRLPAALDIVRDKLEHRLQPAICAHFAVCVESDQQAGQLLVRPDPHQVAKPLGQWLERDADAQAGAYGLRADNLVVAAKPKGAPIHLEADRDEAFEPLQVLVLLQLGGGWLQEDLRLKLATRLAVPGSGKEVVAQRRSGSRASLARKPAGSSPDHRLKARLNARASE